ncbi:MAG: DNA polymerase III subunit delta [Planctomycetes bacterium]|nr:DNA polymerase III subunit delta [Planctomycetota bacterium]
MDFTTFSSGAAASSAAVVLLCGEEAYFREKGLQLLKARASGGFLRVASTETSWTRLADDLYTPSLLGGTKVVAVADEGNFFHNHAADLSAYLSQPSPAAILVGLVPGKTPAVSGRSLVVVECRPLRGLDLQRWAAAEFQRRGKTADRSAVQLLVGRAGAELSALEGHVENLVQHAGRRASVTAEDVRALVADEASHEVYELALAAASKKPDRALEIAHRLLDGREPPQSILWKLAWQYRKMVEARKLLDAGTPPYEVPPRLQITFYADEFLALVRAHAPDELLAKHARILETDLALKSSGGGLDVLLMEKLVCELALDPRRRPAPTATPVS